MEKVFAEGFIFKRQDDAPDFVVGRLSIKASEAIDFIQKHEKNDWLNLNIKYGRSGNPYIELDTFEPKKKDNNQKPPAQQAQDIYDGNGDILDDEPPF